MNRKLIPVLLASVLPLVLSAQVKKSADTATVTVPKSGNSSVPVVALNLKADEAIRTFDLPIQSDEDKAVQVYGAQTTGGLYLVDFPKTITPKGKAAVTLIYIARPNVTGDTEVVRLLTDHGEKVIQVAHAREQVAQLDVSSLQWTQDDAPAGKDVVVTVAPNSVVPKNVKVLGSGATATLQSLGSNRYRITVTPASTAKPQQFPVSIQFAPAYPGVPSIIPCAVVPKG